MTMDYSKRIQMTLNGLADFLRRYKQPDHLDDETSLAEMRSIGEAVNKRIDGSLPENAMLVVLDDVFQNVSENYLGASWPKAAVFVKAVDAVNRRMRPAIASQPVEGEVGGDEWSLRVDVDRMLRGDAVGDGCLYGKRAHQIYNTGAVGKDVFDKYRSGLFFKMRDVWGEEKALQREAEFKAKHDAARSVSGDTGPAVDMEQAGFTPKRFDAVRSKRMARSEAELYEADTIDVKPHWTEVVDPDSPEMQALRKARADNPLMKPNEGANQ